MSRPADALGSAQHVTLAEAFGEPEGLGIGEPTVLCDVVRALSGAIGDGPVKHPGDRLRQRFWAAWDPERMPTPAETMTWVHPGLMRQVVWRLDRHGLRATDPRLGNSVHALPDALFVYGPPTAGAPLAFRERLRQRLLDATGGRLREASGFLRLDDALMPRRTWEWGRTRDGYHWLELWPGEVERGSQAGHDSGSSWLVPERILRGDPATLRSLDLPPAIEAELRALLMQANPEAHHRANFCESLPHTERLAVAVGAAPKDLDLPQRALDLFASLRPGLGPLTWRVVPSLIGPSSGYGDDAVALAHDGTGVVSEATFDADGEPDAACWVRVVPGVDRAVVSEAPTRAWVTTLAVTLSAVDPSALAALKAHVIAFFSDFKPIEVDAGTT